jgi:segregation and condensation protein B
MEPLTLSAQIESVLLFKGGAVSVRDLAAATKETPEAVQAAIEELATDLQGRGVRLIVDGSRVALATAPETKELIETMRREELEGPIGRAGLETLAVVVYQGPVSRADIEYIRGVNVSSALRTLLIRGLVERVEHPTDKRTFLYRVTPDVPAYFGLERLERLPDYDSVRAALQQVVTERPVPESDDAVMEEAA